MVAPTVPQAAEEQLYSMQLDGYWMNVKKPRDFLNGHALYLRYLSQQPPAGIPGGAAAPALTTTDVARASELEREQLAGSNIEGSVLIHPTAQLGAGCLIGPDVSVGPGCVIEEVL